jgi:predicted ATPase
MENRGSIWRKWDIHLHTPGTAKNDQFGTESDELWNQYIEKIEQSDMAVIGVTDYFSMDNYYKLKNYQDNKGRLKRITLLPNVEMRITPVANKKEPINIHAIFNPKLQKEEIDREFFRKLSFEYHEKHYDCTKSSLIDLGKDICDNTNNNDRKHFWKFGISKYCISYEDLFKVLKQNFFRNNVIVAVSNGSHDGLSGLNGQTSLSGVQEEIYRKSNIIFSGCEGDIKYFLGKGKDGPEEIIRRCGKLMPCMRGSDAHTMDNVCAFPDGRYTWVKADPTFEGLRQVCLEPEDRVKICSMIPDSKPRYQVVDNIELHEKGFWQCRIYMNPNLNTIIGGRSTGKSTLLSSIALNVNPDEKDEKNVFINGHQSGVSVNWCDNLVNTKHDIEFFTQGYMHEISEDQNKINSLVINILRQKEQYTLLEQYRKNCEEIKKEISNDLLRFSSLLSSFKEMSKYSITLGDQKGIKDSISDYQSKLQELNKRSPMSDAEKLEYNKIINFINEEESKMLSAEKDLKHFDELKQHPLFNTSYQEESGFIQFSLKNNLDDIQRKYSELVTKTENQWKQIIEELVQRTKDEKTKSQSILQVNKNSDLFKRGENYIKSNVELREIQKKYEVEKNKLKIIEETDKKKSLLSEKLKALRDLIIDNHEKYRSEIELLQNRLQINQDDLSISIKPFFKENDLYDFLSGNLNQRSYERQEYINSFTQKYYDNSASLLKKLFQLVIDEELVCKGNISSLDFLNQILTINWFRADFSLKYQNDDFKEMSPGKQAFVILKLLLDFSDKTCPILIDQPEDSLDNRAIYSDLVKYIRGKKKKRQIILVTHNPNVVVSADAENVIVANQQGNDSYNENDNKFQYVNGALENSFPKNLNSRTVLSSQGIREHVCEILEGGKEAFEKRERKYGFK